VALSCVDLIPGASWAFVLSDVGTGAAGRTGKLGEILSGLDAKDREPPRAMRPGPDCLERKTFSPLFISALPELFTESWGELFSALLVLV